MQNMHFGFRTFIPSVLFLLGSFCTGFSQNSDSLAFLEHQLLRDYSKIMEIPAGKRVESSETFYNEFISCLNIPESFEYPFDTLQNIGKIYSPDHRIRIYTWNIPAGIYENMYYGVVQFYSSEQEKYNIVPLNKTDSLYKGNPLKMWEGSLYYKIVETKHAGQKYYTLLGFDLNSILSNKKTIDVIAIDDFDDLYFCEKLLQYEGLMVDRIVFEYNEKAMMSMQYNEDLKMIVFDHLSPSKPSLNGQYEFYGPDFTYDGLKWEKGIWMFYSNIDITN